MRFKSTKDSQDFHRNNYHSDGISKLRYSIQSKQYMFGRVVVNEVPEKALVLDVGCNGGTIGIMLKNEKNCYVKGIDIVSDLVELAKKRGIVAKVGTAEKLEFTDNKFDCITCIEVLEHLFDPELAVSEAYRVLKDGGKYICSFPIEEAQLGDYHHKQYTKEEAIKILKTKFNKVNIITIKEKKDSVDKWMVLTAIKGE